MRLSIFLTSLLLFLQVGYSQTDTLKSTAKFMISLTAFETGALIPLKYEQSQGGRGISEYLGKPQTAPTFGMAGVSFWYKEKFGLEVMLIKFSFYSYNNQEFQNWFKKNYPNHYTKNNFQRSWESVMPDYRIAYRMNFKHFQLTPKFHFGVYRSREYYEQNVYLKEKGSNQFVKYNLKTEDLKKRIAQYQFSLEASRRFKQKTNLSKGIEYALRAGVSITPTNFRYTVTETPYGQSSVVTTQDVKENKPYFSVEAVLRYYFKFGEK